MSAETDRSNKIIVALFLVLGKAVNSLNAKQRNQLSVTESEIRKAWTEQKSPVRLVSELKQNQWADPDSDTVYASAVSERVYKVVMGDLDLRKTGMDLKGKMPEEPKPMDALKPGRRCFDLE